MASESRVLGVAVIGCGHWGPNHLRVFSELPRSQVLACADLSKERLARVKRRFPQLHTTRNYRDLLSDPAIDAVVVATPTRTHASITHEALEAGKHVLVEKPLCMTAKEARELTMCADAVGRVMMVGHVFLFNNGIIKLHEVIEDGGLGHIHYLDAARTNLGPVRGDVNALFDLGTHDISIFNYLLGATPVAVAAHGSCISQDTIEDVCFATLKYPDGTLGHIHVSWLNPRKVRTLTVVGQSKMAHWDDVDPADTLRLFDKGIEEPPYYDSFGEFQFLLRNADVHVPQIDRVEPLVNQANAFLDTVLEGKPCRSGGGEAEAVVAVLEAATRSIETGGTMCAVSSPCVTEETTKCELQVTGMRPSMNLVVHNL